MIHPETRSQRIYRKLAVASFVTVFLLILIGGTVRITGAGMGCPDWPKCFGRWVPPTDESQLPADYREIYAGRGYDSMAFNATKTWTEYLNRLFGALTGLVALAAAVFSLSWWKRDKIVTISAISVGVLVAIAGWLGARVVESNLDSTAITIHLLVALGVFFFNILSLVRSSVRQWPVQEQHTLARMSWFNVLALIALLAQMILGTFVRGEMDAIAERMGEGARALWLLEAKVYFPIHRVLSFGVLALLGLVAVRLFMLKEASIGVRAARTGLAVSLFGQLATALAFETLGFPAIAQLLHLAFSVGMFASVTYVLCRGLASGALNESFTEKDIRYA